MALSDYTLADFAPWAVAGLVVLAFLTCLSCCHRRGSKSAPGTAPDILSLKRYLTHRYLIAIGCIALLAVVSYTVLNYSIATQQSNGTIINISGKQRMLSQRISLFALKLTTQQGESLEATRDELKSLIGEMREAHNTLSTGNATLGIDPPRSEAVHNMYFQSPMRLSDRVIGYLDRAENIASLPATATTQQSALTQRLLAESPALLRDLNKMVFQYEDEAHADIATVQWMELAVLVCTLVALLLIVRFIFRPMVQGAVEAHADVKEKQKLLSFFVKHTPASVAMLDKDLHYIDASQQWIREFQLTSPDIIGLHHLEPLPDAQIDHEQWKKDHMQALAGETVTCEEMKVTRKDGSEEWFRYVIRPWKFTSNAVGGVIVFVDNITARRHMEQVKDEFISTVSHELRTPLTSIQGSMGMLKHLSEDKLDDQGKRLLDISYKNCKHLTHLVNDILDVEKIACGKMDYYMETAELEPLVSDIVEQHQGYADKYKVELRMEDSAGKCACKLDKQRFTQALGNILSNAIKFSPEGQIVRLVMQKNDPGQVRISISDKGPGIPEEFKAKIFGKFARADNSTTRTKGGTGLGLNIAKSIIEAFGGGISFDSREGEGTTFHILLPAS